MDKNLASEVGVNKLAIVGDDNDDDDDGAAKPETKASSSSVVSAAPVELGSKAKAEQAFSGASEDWQAWVERYINKHCLLVVEKGASQTQLANMIAASPLGQMRGNAAGNFLVYFDANLWGEALTSAHIRRAPVQKKEVQRLWGAVQQARNLKDQVGLLPPGDVLILIDGDRTSEQLVNLFGMGHARRRTDKGRTSRDGKTVARCIILNLVEKSVKARKFRRKTRNDFINCFQRAHIFYNASTKMSERAHLHFPDTTNMSNALGPFTLQAYEAMPLMSLAEKKLFWQHRRRAVGGAPEPEQSEEDAESEQSEDGAEELPAPEITEIELPGVGLGRGNKGLDDNVLQPVSFHSLPPLVAESLAHSVWETGILDMTPGSRGVMKTKVLSGSGGYLGICATAEQRDFLLKILKAEILQQMECPDSKVYLLNLKCRDCTDFPRFLRIRILIADCCSMVPPNAAERQKWLHNENRLF